MAAKLQKEMSIINRNHIVQQQLNNYMSELHSEQVRALEKCKAEQKLIWENLRKVRTSTGASKCGTKCNEKTDTKLRIRHLNNRNWKLGMKDSEIPESPPSLPPEIRPWTTDNTYKPQRSASHASSLMRNRPETQHTYRSPLVSFEETTPLKDVKEPTVVDTQEMPAQPTETGEVEESEVITPLEECVSERANDRSELNWEERKVVRNNTIRMFAESLPKLENTKISGYIKPELRHRYDLLTIKRLLYLKKSIPATRGTTESKPLTSTFSLNSRRAALENLVSLNNQMMEKTYHSERNVALEDRVKQFLQATY